MSAVVIENLTKLYGDFKALDSLNLVVEEREIFGFLGPNGSGKSTTINCILGLIRPNAGRIEVCGIDVERKPLEVKKICGYMPERYGLYENLTAMQNLKYFAEFYGGISKDWLYELLELVGLSAVADKKVAEFSRGMKQRLALAQALINDPQVLFLDEPTNGLDPQGIADFRRIIKELQKKGKTIFFSSHILAEVKEVCKTIGIIHRGRLVKSGKISELVNKTKIVLQTEPEISKEMLEKFGKVSYEETTKSFLLEVEKDCRLELSKFLVENRFLVKELHLKEPSLEEVYFSLVGGPNEDLLPR
ncbi:MAG: ABC transporter ATP-binding protein [Archaeoglobaceae archaeon]